MAELFPVQRMSVVAVGGAGDALMGDSMLNVGF